MGGVNASSGGRLSMSTLNLRPIASRLTYASESTIIERTICAEISTSLESDPASECGENPYFCGPTPVPQVVNARFMAGCDVTAVKQELPVSQWVFCLGFAVD